jgi:hypothetical protein
LIGTAQLESHGSGHPEVEKLITTNYPFYYTGKTWIFHASNHVFFVWSFIFSPYEEKHLKHKKQVRRLYYPSAGFEAPVVPPTGATNPC